MDLFLWILVRIAMIFVISLIFGFALLKIYDLFMKGVREKSRFKIWWAFSSGIFLLGIIIFLFSR